MKGELKGVVEINDWGGEVVIEFGRTQAAMNFSENGKLQRSLKLKEGDKVKVTIEKVE